MKNKNIADAAATVLILTVFSKVIGFVESAVVAAYFGTSAQVDMFFLANSIANKFIFTVFSGLSVVGLTMYNSAICKGGQQGGNRFISALIRLVIPIALLVTACIYLLSPLVAEVFGKNYSATDITLLVKYLKQLSVVSVFFALTTIFTAILNANKVFFPAVLLGAIQNGTMILFIVFAAKSIGVASVVGGFVFSYVLQTLFLYICARKVFSFEKSSIRSDIDVKRMTILILPLMLGEATGEINTLIDQYLAAKQGTGYISGLAYSETLNDVVTALFIQTVSSVLLSYFSELAVKKQFNEMLFELKRIMKIITLILVPVSIVTVINAKELVSFVFARGSFNGESVKITALALVGYAGGFVFKTLMVIVKRPFFAIENTRVPMVMGLVTVVINISLSIILSRYIGILGITLGTSVAYTLAAAIYFILLKTFFKEMVWKDCKGFCIKVGIATVITTITVVVSKKLIITSDFVCLVYVTLISFGVYFFILKVMRLEEINHVTHYILRKVLHEKEKV